MTISSDSVVARVVARVKKGVDEPETTTEDIGELDIAEYMVFMLSLDTYMRYVHEQAGPGVEDDLIRKGIQLVKMADRAHAVALQAFMDSHLPSPTHKKMLAKAFRYMPTPEGLSRRALQLRTVLSRGGSSVMRAVFKNNRALAEVRTAMSAATIDDADAALDKLAAISMRNSRLRGWIDKAAETAGSGTFQNAVTSAVRQASDDHGPLQASKIEQAGSSATSEDAGDAQAKHDDRVLKVQQESTEAARKALAISGESDEPPKKSEVIGIATAVAKAIAADPVDETNIPEALKHLDPEQRAAAMTDGHVRVGAGAGSGKSTTLVARIKQLVEGRGTTPGRILACSFNTKAAEELKSKVAKSIGPDKGRQVIIGTMNSLFNSFIVGNPRSGFAGFGTPEEKGMLTGNRLIASPKDKPQSGGPAEREDDELKGKRVTPLVMSSAIRKIWGECGVEALTRHTGFAPEVFDEGVPKAKKMNLYMNKWQGNDITLEEARKTAKKKDELLATIWYEFYMGLKGDIPGWSPPCGPSSAHKKFMEDYRKGGERLGDLNDQLKVLRDILKRDPKARAAIQSKFDHLLVDEAQDLNIIQHQVFDMMSEHISYDGSDNKSIWMVGDDKQCIYEFRGARPELFVGLEDKGWKSKMIRTNYRCEPEIVDAANRLIAHNSGQIPMEAQANPKKERKQASIVVQVPGSNASAAIDTIGRCRKDLDTNPDAKPENYAVLARTNSELNDFETACIINEIPYVRRGGNGFLDAPESKAVLSYIDLASGTDYEKKAESLTHALQHPDRGLFLGPADVEKAVKDTLDDVARKEHVDIRSVDPTEILKNRQYARMLAENLKRKYKIKIVNSTKDRVTGRPDPKKGEWLFNKLVDELASQITTMGQQVGDVAATIEDPKAESVDLINGILDNISGTKKFWDRDKRQEVVEKVSLRDHISARISLFSDDDDEDESDVEDEKPEFEEGTEGLPGVEVKEREGKGLGAVQFLYALATPNKNDELHATDPTLAGGFQKKIQRYGEIAQKLRIDPKKWAAEQKKITDPKLRQEKPPAITLSTVHSVKGMEWPNVTVMMPKGKFPMERKPKPGEPPPDPEEVEAELKAERNLAYVAVTRAAKNLEIHAIPGKSVAGMPPPLSRFVSEAGLVPGENVPKDILVGGTPADEPPPGPGGVKEASEADEFINGLVASMDDETAMGGDTYDRRTT